MAMSEKRKVNVHVTFLKVGEINTLKECFEADVLLKSQWREPDLDVQGEQHYPIEKDLDLSEFWNPLIYIDNVIGDPKLTSSIIVEYTPQGHAYVTERRRVKGLFLENMELWDFPFDIQDLSVTIMSEKSSEEVEIIDDPKELHKIYKQSFIDEQEWYLYKYTESLKTAQMKDQADPTVMRSALTVRCRSARRPHYFLWNSFSITFLICCLSFITFSVDSQLPQNRLQLTFTLVLTTVAYKFVVNQTLPKISYLSYLDRYVLATLSTLGVLCIWHGIVSTIPIKQETGILWSDRVALCIFGSGYLLFNIIFVSFIWRNPYKRRREMKRKEETYINELQIQAERKGNRSSGLGYINKGFSDKHVSIAVTSHSQI